MAIKMLFVALLLNLVFAFRRVASLEEYKLGVLVPYSYDMNWDYPAADNYASAVTLAVEKVNNDPTLLKGAKLSFVWNNTACNQTKMIEQQHWQIKQGVVGFVGPSCHGRKAAKIARKHDLPVVSFDCQDTHVSNKKLYPNFARTNPQLSKAAMKSVTVLKKKGVEKVNIVYQDAAKWLRFEKYLSLLLRGSGVKIASRNKVDMRTFYFGVPEFLYTLPSKAQATILATSLSIVREAVYNVQNYFDKNPSDSYAKHSFVSPSLDRVSVNANIRNPYKWFHSSYAISTPQTMNTTQRAFRKLSIITVVPRKVTKKFESFEEELKIKSAGYPWFSKEYQGCLFLDGRCIFDKSTAKIPFKGVYLYDAVIQFATALHEVRQAGQKPSGENIVNRLKGRSFISANGYPHQFDNNADVMYDYTVLRLTRDKNNKLNMLPVNSLDNRQ